LNGFLTIPKKKKWCREVR